jgi:hypothetical protein
MSNNPNTVKVYLKSQDKTVDAVVLSSNRKTIRVQLPDGNVIKRHKLKHIMH